MGPNALWGPTQPKKWVGHSRWFTRPVLQRSLMYVHYITQAMSECSVLKYTENVLGSSADLYSCMIVLGPTLSRVDLLHLIRNQKRRFRIHQLRSVAWELTLFEAL